MSFEEHYDRYFPAIFRYIYYMTGRKELAEDLTQETFLRLYKGQFLQRSAIETYLRQIARHLVYDYYRKKALIKWLPFAKEHEQARPSLFEEFAQLEDKRRLYEAIYALKLSYRDVIIYRQIEGYSVHETAQILGWSTVKVVNTQRSAMQQLEKTLGGMPYEFG